MNGEESNIQKVVIDKNAFSKTNCLGGASGTGCRVLTTGSSQRARERIGNSTTGLFFVLVIAAIVLAAGVSSYGGYGGYGGYPVGPYGYNNQYYGYYY